MSDQPEQDTYTLIPMYYKCLVCGTDVGTEEMTGMDQHRHPITLYYPASRYWYSKGHPSKNNGVFCSAEHAASFLVDSYRSKG